MPRVKPIGVDPNELAIRTKIGGGMAAMQLTQKELAKRTGIDPATLSRRMKDVRTFRLGELWAIEKVFKAGGVI